MNFITRFASIRPGQSRVLLVGDLINDVWIKGDINRISPEAPVPILHQQERIERLGGAGGVAAMLDMLGAQYTFAFAAPRASDWLSERLDATLPHCREYITIPTDALVPQKIRYLAHDQQILRVDIETVQSPSRDDEMRLLSRLKAVLDDVDVVVISDYDKGLCTSTLIYPLIEICRERRKPVIADIALCDRYHEKTRRYRGATLLTPNRRELSAALQYPRVPKMIATLHERGSQLCANLELGGALITCDRDGIVVVDAEQSLHVPLTRTRQVYDVTGAGDMVLAVIGFCAGAGWPLKGDDLVDLATIANAAAELEVERLGAVPITHREILQALLASHPPTKETALDDLVITQRAVGKKLVFTNGCFEALHAGHIHLFEAAKKIGDFLVVGLNSDASFARIRNRTSLATETQRSATVAAIRHVDAVVTFDEDTPIELIARLRPDVLVKGSDYKAEAVVGYKVVTAYGGIVVTVPVLTHGDLKLSVRRLCDAEVPANLR